MKKIAIVSLLTALLAGNVLAANISVPFTNKIVPTEGLMISYNTDGAQKVVCIADNFYKGWVYITKDSALKDTGITFGDYDEQNFYFTSLGKDKEIGHIEQFHVDKSGYIKLKDSNFDLHKSFVSCFYAPDHR